MTRVDLISTSFQELLGRDCSTYELLRYAANLHRVELEARLYSLLDGTVAAGPFVGMRCLGEAHASVLSPKLLGTYEKEIQPDLLGMIGSTDSFLDIGCAEGYYTTGLARFEQLKCVVGVDINQRSLAAATLMAQMNGCEGKCSFVSSVAEALPQLKGSVLVMIDVDGAEIPVIHEFFQVSAGEGSSGLSYRFIVETDYYSGGASNRDDIVLAFEEYGFLLDKEVVQDPAQRFSAQAALLTRSFLDLAVCGMEGRPVDQSWLIFSRPGI